MSNLPPPNMPIPRSGHPDPGTPSTSGRTTRAGLAAIGLVLTAIAMVLPWGTSDRWDKDRNAMEVTTQAVWDDTPADLETFPLVIPLVVLCALMLIGIVKPKTLGLTLLASALVTLIGVMFMLTMGGPSDVGVGTLLAIAGGLVGVAGSIRALQHK